MSDTHMLWIYRSAFFFLVIVSIGKSLCTTKETIVVTQELQEIDLIAEYNDGFRNGRQELLLDMVNCEGVKDSVVLERYSEIGLANRPWSCEE